MKKKTSNILIIILAAIIVFCGVMAVGTFKGWFGGDDKMAEQEASSKATVSEEQSGDSGKALAEEAAKQDQEGAKAASTDKASAGNATATDNGSSNSNIGVCTIAIKCNSILSYSGGIPENKAKYIPSNGVILSTSSVEFKKGDSIYDVLKRTCSAAGIPMSSRNSSMGIYVEGINNLFEFDFGDSSGWMYSVNGTAPNHGSGNHTVKNGDSIVWYYTCGN